MIRTKGEAGTGDIVNAVTHMRAVFGGSAGSARCATTSSSPRRRSCARRRARALGGGERAAARRHLHRRRHRDARPTRRSACSSARTACSSARASSSPAIPALRAKAIVEATTHYADPKILAEVSAGLGEPMVGISSASLAEASGSKCAAGSPPRP